MTAKMCQTTTHRNLFPDGYPRLHCCPGCTGLAVLSSATCALQFNNIAPFLSCVKLIFDKFIIF